jgi:hypothetical protein
MEMTIPLFCEFAYGWLPVDLGSEDPLINSSICWGVGQLSEGSWNDKGFICAECLEEATG